MLYFKHNIVFLLSFAEKLLPLNFKAIAELLCVSEQHNGDSFSEWTCVLNKSFEPMIQNHIHKVSRLLNSWMNQQFKQIQWMTQKHIYRHLLAVLVSYLEYHFI